MSIALQACMRAAGQVRETTSRLPSGSWSAYDRTLAAYHVAHSLPGPNARWQSRFPLGFSQMVPVALPGPDQPATRGAVSYGLANGETQPAPRELESAILPSNLSTGTVNMMTPARMPLAHLLYRRGETDSDTVKVLLVPAVPALSGAEVSAVCSAGHRTRVEENWPSRNGHRFPSWGTRVGPLGLEISNPRQCSLLPRSLQPTGPSGRPSRRHRGTGCVQPGGGRFGGPKGGWAVSKSDVSRICEELDRERAPFRDWPMDSATTSIGGSTLPTTRCERKGGLGVSPCPSRSGSGRPARSAS